MAEDRASNLNRRFPSGVTKKTTNYKVTQPGVEVAASTQKATLHHEGNHVVMDGPATISGRGAAGKVAKVLGAIKEAHR